MFIAKYPPNIFVDAETLAPEDINENNKYFLKAFNQVADQQTSRWTSTYSLVSDAATALTNTTITRRMPSASFHTITATPPVVIESYSITIYYTSTVTFDMTLPSGDIITFPVRDSSKATENYNVVRLINYSTTSNNVFTVVIPAAASITKFDVEVGFSSDKYLSGNYGAALTKPSLDLVSAISYTGTGIPVFNDFNPASANTFSLMKTALENGASAANTGAPFRWEMAEFRNVTSTSDIFYASKPIPCYADPSFSSVTSAARIIGTFAYIEFSSAPAGSLVSFGPTDNTGAFLANVSITGTTMGTGTGTYANGIKSSYANSLRYTAADVTTNDRLIRIQSATAGAVIDYAAVYILLQ